MPSHKIFRELTCDMQIGNTPLGGEYPIRLQSMTTSNTLDVEATVLQCIQIADAGADFVRITAQGVREAEALQEIKQKLKSQGYTIPLVADIHFQPKAALVAAQYVEKVRINPGNFSERDAENDESNEQLRKDFYNLLHICKQHKTALRIGVNHGSLSARILKKYGDTPEGMVESAMEYLRICKLKNFTNVVISMKSSNTRIMVYATRLLAQTMNKEGMNFPLHLGVTEAGEGEDGRIKSAVGIGTLLADGIGNTFRISLTEPPQNEIPIAQKLLAHFSNKLYQLPAESVFSCITTFQKRSTQVAISACIGGKHRVGIVANLSNYPKIEVSQIEALGFVLKDNIWQAKDNTPDAIYIGSAVCDAFALEGLNILSDENEYIFTCTPDSLSADTLLFLKENPNILLLLEQKEEVNLYAIRHFFEQLQYNQVQNPVLLHFAYNTTDYEALQLYAAADFGALLIDGFGDGIMLSSLQSIQMEAEKHLQTSSNDNKQSHIAHRMQTVDEVRNCLTILQAARVRFSKTEYIACPGCGRTLFDLQKILQEVKQHTSHLKGLKIAVMGCIVNGVGEMADADYGYVGSGVGKVSLYKGKECIQKNIEQSQAVQELLKLINAT
ncbi:MAG: (E)-4-hydroxy-3-methylbut-2-enyl-diphosphate synthase [Bacteroidales bacterium]